MMNTKIGSSHYGGSIFMLIFVDNG